MRHPIYAVYLITAVAYMAENPSLWNVAVFVIHFAGQVVRIRTEETVLARDPDYRAYQAAVRYRLIPGIYETLNAKR